MGAGSSSKVDVREVRDWTVRHVRCLRAEAEVGALRGRTAAPLPRDSMAVSNEREHIKPSAGK